MMLSKELMVWREEAFATADRNKRFVRAASMKRTRNRTKPMCVCRIQYLDANASKQGIFVLASHTYKTAACWDNFYIIYLDIYLLWS